MRRITVLLCCILLAAGFARADGPLTQPAAASKSWEFRPPPMPELAAILNAAKSNPHIYGLYTWPGEYQNNLDSIRKVGWKSFRVGGTIGDDEMKVLVA